MADDLQTTTDGRVPGERGRATRQKLLDATVELLTTTPWRSVKVIDIARAAGTSPATFYQYFENVEQAIGVLAEGMVAEAGELADLVDGDWSEVGSWSTALAVTEGFLAFWEGNRAIFRVVNLANEEGDPTLRGIRVRALNAVTVALAAVIGGQRPGTTPTTLTTPTGADATATATADARRDVRQCRGPPPRVRVLGDPDAGPRRRPGAPPALGGDRPPGAGRGRPPGTDDRQ